MKVGLGLVGWPPDVFWAATMFEYTAAVAGKLLAKGVKETAELTRDELLDMIAEDERRTKAS